VVETVGVKDFFDLPKAVFRVNGDQFVGWGHDGRNKRK
jgi:hypothetical protein